VILDEPNANLDGAGEQALAETLADLRGKATVVVVTHRSTLVVHVDKMLVLDAGRVQHFGSVAEVTRAMQAKAPPPAQVVNMPRAAQHQGAA
jgi:ABC-type protease/lipase transport system fused ATPase/permease subunit